ncbi:MAG: endonuclease/exonuclease/phosphatase family protein [Actinomycetota bacterium]
MRVATFNIQSCRAGVERVADVLRATGAEVLLLTEVRRAHLRPLAQATSMRATFGRTWRFKPFGNAILTREGHQRVLHVRFSRTPNRQPRGMVAVRLVSGLTVAVTHLGLSPDERVRHAKECLAALSPFRDPVVLAGDLNDLPSGPAVGVLLARFRDAFPAVGAEPSLTHPAESPVRRIDYVLVSGITVRKATVVPLIASDHLPVVAELVV